MRHFKELGRSRRRGAPLPSPLPGEVQGGAESPRAPPGAPAAQANQLRARTFFRSAEMRCPVIEARAAGTTRPGPFARWCASKTAIVVLALAGCVLIGQGLYIHAKAALAQVLLDRAF